jgi:hypothetical protein
MRLFARLVAVFLMVVGVVALVASDRLIAFGHQILTPAGLYVIAALRIGMGLVLIGAAPASRAPKVLRVLGVIVVAAGVATPFFGAERSRLILDWWAAQGPVVLRVPGVLLLAAGGGLTYLLGTGHRA